MYGVLSIFLTGVYLLLPVASITAFVVRRAPPWLRRSVAGGWISGMLLGGALLAAYVYAIGGQVTVAQASLTLYLGVALLLLLKLADHVLTIVVRKLFRLESDDAPRRRRLAATLFRVVVFSSLALPWIMASVMVYRPRLVVEQTPASVLELDYADVEFPAADDGTRIAGWYIPADAQRGGGTTTALLCHGLGSGRAGFFQLVRALHEQQVNVLIIDHRAHGLSGGQVCTFGYNEARDVRGAVEWLRQNHSDASQRIIGIGASMGAAALLRAASEDERIDAVVAIGTYDAMSAMSRDVADHQLVPPISWLTRAFGLPMASLHAGVDLGAVRPADAIARVWPRPVLVIHGTDDQIIPFEHGERLYDAAYEPRSSMWVQRGTHNGVLESPEVHQRIIDFMRSARPVPVI